MLDNVLITMDELVEFYITNYRKDVIAKMLATAHFTGELPVIPENLINCTYKNRVGRPTVQTREKKMAALAALLERYYPEQVTIPVLAAETGMAVSYLKKLQNQQAFLDRLPIDLRSYFQGIKFDYKARLAPIWRALLDLHYYALAMEYPYRLRLYQTHLPVYTRQRIHLNAPYQSARNKMEWDRIVKLTGIDYGERPLCPDYFSFPCSEGECELTRHFINQDLLGLNIEALRRLVDPNNKLTWLPVGKDAILTNLTNTKEIIGGLRISIED